MALCVPWIGHTPLCRVHGDSVLPSSFTALKPPEPHLFVPCPLPGPLAARDPSLSPQSAFSGTPSVGILQLVASPWLLGDTTDTLVVSSQANTVIGGVCVW